MKFHRGKKGTQTSSFGSPGRINHDSTPFYTSKLYEGLPKEQEVKYDEDLTLNVLEQYGVAFRWAEKDAHTPEGAWQRFCQRFAQIRMPRNE